MSLGRLHVLTDRFEVAVAAILAGAPVVQVRVKDGSDREAYELVCRVREVAAPTGATVLVNDRVDVAVAAGAHGAHVGAEDLPVAGARRVLGPAALLGATARDPEIAPALAAAGASYLGVGPAYPTTTKAGLPEPLGTARLGAVARVVEIPVIAVGGVTPDRVAELIEVGVHGVAVVGGIGRAVDPAAATAAYLEALDRAGAS